MKLFAPIYKVDEQRRMVYGRAAQEVVDKADEIFDYVTSKPYFKTWSDSIAADTDGKSVGNLRAMHGKVVAGKLTGIDFNDTEKAIDVSAKVVDDNEWNKVLEGCYTGFSIGGSYVGDRITEKAEDGSDVKRYTAKPIEVSLVDLPCIPTAKFFDIVKADGAVEKREFKTTTIAPTEVTGTDEEVAEFAKALNDGGLNMADAVKIITEHAAKREFTQEERDKAAESGAALPDGSFPIKTKADLRNAVSAYGRAKDKAKAKAHIIARAKALGAESELPADWAKLEAIGDLAALLELAESHATLEKRLADPELPMVEFMELAGRYLTKDELAAVKFGKTDDVAKAVLAKAKMSAADADRLQAAHDHLAAMGATCGGEKAAPAGDLSKVAGLEKTVADMAAKIDKLEKQPMPHAITLRAVTKGQASAKNDLVQKIIEVGMNDARVVKNADGTIDFEETERRFNQA